MFNFEFIYTCAPGGTCTKSGYPILRGSLQYRFHSWEQSYPILPDSLQYRFHSRELVSHYTVLRGSLQYSFLSWELDLQRLEQSYPILLCSAQYRFLIWEHSYPILPDSQQYRSLIRELVNSHPMLHGSLQCGPKREQSIKRFRDTEITDTCYSISMSTSPSEFVLAMCLKTFFASNFCTLRTSAGLKSFLISNYLWM